MEQFFVESPYWLLLLAPVVISVLLWHQRSRQGHMHKTLPGGCGGRGTLARPPFFMLCAALSLFFTVMALVDVTRGFVEVQDEYQTSRIIIGLDNSSSMYKFDIGDDPIYCANENISVEYPRIAGACNALLRLIDETKSFAHENNSVSDHIALVRFARHSFVHVYPTDDYNRLRDIVKHQMNWRNSSALGIHTEIHLALWDMLQLALERNTDSSSGVTLLSLRDVRLLFSALAPEGKKARLILHKQLMEKIESLKMELRDTVFIIITDGLYNQLNSVIDKPPVSLQKIMQFAALLELPVYFVSTEDMHIEYKRLARETGFGPSGGAYRGDFLLVGRGGKRYDQMADLVANILETRHGMTTPTKTPRRVSYTSSFAVLALLFLICAICLREIRNRSLTDV